MNDRLGKAVRAGDMQTAAQLLQQYNHAGGRPLPGLTQRRQEEGRWMLGQPPSPQALAAGRQAEARAQGQPPPMPGTATSEQMDRYARGGGGWLDLPQLAQRIDAANPNASPQVKFRALQKGMGLLNAGGQNQFRQFIEQQRMQETYRHNTEMEQIAKERIAGGEGKSEVVKDQSEKIGQAIIDGSQAPDLKGLGTKVSAGTRAYLKDQGFNLTRAQMEWTAAQKQVTALNTQQATSLRDTGATVLRTIDEVKELSEQMKLSGVQFLNKSQLNYYIKYRGNTEEGQLATRYITAVNDLKEYFAKIQNGGYAPTESVWKLVNRQVNEDYGLEQMNASLTEVRRLIDYRLQSAGAGGAVVPGGGTSRYAPPRTGVPAAEPSGAAAAPKGGVAYDAQGNEYHQDASGNWVDKDGKPYQSK